MRSSHRMRIPDTQDMVVRMSYCATSDWLTEEKGRVKMRSISLRDVATYSRCMADICFESAAVSAASITAVRAWATFDDTGAVRSSATYGQAAKKLSRGCYVHRGRDHLHLAAHNSDVGALSAVLRGSGAAGSVGASARVPLVASVASPRGMPVSSLTGGSAAPSVATPSRVSSASGDLPVVLRQRQV